MPLASAHQSRLQPVRLPPPTPELMTVKDAATWLRVNETWLRNLLLHMQMPVQGKDSWGNDLYRLQDIREQLRP